MASIAKSWVCRVPAIGVAVALLSTGCTAMGTPAEAQSVRIAANLELSGAQSQLGTVFRNALELRVEQVNQQGLIRDGRVLELDIRDNRSDPAVSATNLREFASDASVAAIISGTCAECLLSAADTISDEGVPTISLASTDAVIEPTEDVPAQSIFKLGPNATHVATVIASELRSSRARTVAIVATDDLYGSDGMKEMEDAALDLGLQVVLKDSLAPGGGGISSTAQTIADYRNEPLSGEAPRQNEQVGPDAVVAWGFSPFGAEVAAALRGAGYAGALYLDPGAADTLFITDEATALTGAKMIFTEMLIIDEVLATSPAKANRRNWFNDYTARYGTYHAHASFAADAIDVLVSSMNRTNTADRATIRAALEAVELDGLTGAIRMSPRHHSGLTTQALVTLIAREDRWRLAR